MRRRHFLPRSGALAGGVLALALLLTGCGSGGGGLGGDLLSALRQSLTRGGGEDVRASLTPAVLAQVTDPLMLVEIPSLDAVAVTQVFGRNNRMGDGLEYVTWQTVNDVSFSFGGHVLNATRGLGHDLMAADIRDPAAALSGRSGGQGVRIHRYLGEENQLEVRSFTCSYAQGGRQTIEIVGTLRDVSLLTETCHATDLTITNRYWTSRDGFLWKSRQWVSEEIGYLLTERLIR